jgi:hypothetical protein
MLCMKGDRRGRDRMVVGFTTTYVINIYHHLSCQFESHSWRGALNTTLCDKVIPFHTNKETTWRKDDWVRFKILDCI